MRLPISVTGTLIRKNFSNLMVSRVANPLKSAKGFTLFEIIVVVIIVTISVSAILFSTSFISGSSDLKILGNDLSKTMRLLYQEAIFESKNYAISINHQGFKVLEYDGQNWTTFATVLATSKRMASRHHLFAEAIQPVVQLDLPDK